MSDLLATRFTELTADQYARLLARYPQVAKEVCEVAQELPHDTVTGLLRSRKGRVRAAAIVRTELSDDEVRNHLEGEKNAEVLAAGFDRIRANLTAEDVSKLLDKGTQATYAFLLDSLQYWAPVVDRDVLLDFYHRIATTMMGSASFVKSKEQDLSALAAKASKDGILPSVDLSVFQLHNDSFAWGAVLDPGKYSANWWIRQHYLLADLLARACKGEVQLSDKQWQYLWDSASTSAQHQEAVHAVAKCVLSHSAPVLACIVESSDELTELQAVYTRESLQERDVLEEVAESATFESIRRAHAAGCSFEQVVEALADHAYSRVGVLTELYPQHRDQIVDIFIDGAPHNRVQEWNLNRTLEALVGDGPESTAALSRILRTTEVMVSSIEAAQVVLWALDHQFPVADIPLPAIRIVSSSRFGGRASRISSWLLDNISDSEWDVVDSLWDSWQGTVGELQQAAQTL